MFASPVPPVFATPYMNKMFSANKVRHKSMDETFVVNPSSDITSPELPVFVTPSLKHLGKKQHPEEQIQNMPKMESLSSSPPAEPQMCSSRDNLTMPGPAVNDHFVCPDTPEMTCTFRFKKVSEHLNL